MHSKSLLFWWTADSDWTEKCELFFFSGLIVCLCVCMFREVGKQAWVWIEGQGWDWILGDGFESVMCRVY